MEVAHPFTCLPANPPIAQLVCRCWRPQPHSGAVRLLTPDQAPENRTFANAGRLQPGQEMPDGFAREIGACSRPFLVGLERRMRMEPEPSGARVRSSTLEPRARASRHGVVGHTEQCLPHRLDALPAQLRTRRFRPGLPCALGVVARRWSFSSPGWRDARARCRRDSSPARPDELG